MGGLQQLLLGRVAVAASVRAEAELVYVRKCVDMLRHPPIRKAAKRKSADGGRESVTLAVATAEGGRGGQHARPPQNLIAVLERVAMRADRAREELERAEVTLKQAFLYSFVCLVSSSVPRSVNLCIVGLVSHRLRRRTADVRVGVRSCERNERGNANA